MDSAARRHGRRLRGLRLDRLHGGNVRSGFGLGFNPPYGGVSGDKNNLAAVDITTHRFLAWAPRVARYVSVGALAVSNGKVLASGEFASSLG